jgi:hypothetical protein
MKISNIKKIMTLFALLGVCCATGVDLGKNICEGKTEDVCEKECSKLGGKFLRNSETSGA